MNKTLHRASLLTLALAGAFSWTTGQAATRAWSYTYNSLGLIETADGPRTDVEDVTRYDYNERGQLTRVTNALGHVTRLDDFDGYGNPQSVTDANGVVSTLTYTPQGWLASVTTAGSTTTFEHDAIGQIIKLTRGDGSWLRYTYDGARRLKAIENNLNETIEFDVDPMGNRTAQRIKDATGSLTQQQRWVYDELGRLLRSIGAAEQTQQYRYDLNDNPEQTTNPRDYSHTQAFDALDRLVTVTDPLNGVTTLDYDAQDNLREVKDPRGVTTRYAYDGLGNLKQLISPDSGTTTYEPDAAGNVIRKTDARGVVTEYQYDALNRLTLKRYPANPALNVQYHYDMTANGNHGIGRLTAVQDASGVLGYTYDQRGNLTEQLRSVVVNGNDQYDNLVYAYDAANQLTRIDYPAGFSVHYRRNAAGQVTGVDYAVGSNPPTPLASGIGYAPFGPLKGLTWGNDLSLTRQYDQDYQLREQQIGNWQSRYTPDANGNIVELAHSLWGTLAYSYDPLDRLIEEKSASDKKTYGYDATGNREHRTTYSLTNGSETQQAKQSLTYESTSNRLSKRSNAFAVEVDAAGNYTRYSYGRRYTYDEQGRLSQALTADGTLLASYRYNALGQRTTKQVHKNGLIYPFTYLYGPDGQLLGEVEYLSSGRKKRAQYFVWLDGMPLAAIELSYASDGSIANSTTTYLHADHLNTPRLATNQAGQLVWSWQSDAFGVGNANTDVDGDGMQTDIPLRFPGQIADIHSSLHYNYFRDYDPETGRYVESDPIGLNGGLNTYGYVGGNPLGFTDSYGLEAIQNTATIAGCGFGATLGATGGAALGGAGGLLCGPGALACSPVAGAAMATGGAALGCAAGGAVGNVLGGAVETVIEWCTDDDDKKDKCIDICHELALPTSDYGVQFQRCMNQCMGITDYDEWRPYFP